MDKEYIINGKRYVLTEEEKKAERLSGWINKEQFKEDCWMTSKRTRQDNTRMVEIRDNEVIVSREQVIKAMRKDFPDSELWAFNNVLKELGL